MICDDNSCGTGSGNIPLPGDPNNNGVLSAKPAFGGIDVNWTFPTTNPFAVAYTTIYRALSADFVGAILLVPQVGGGFYYDPVDPGIEYFYWITFVSVNGTIGEVIGPVSAVARSSIEKTIEDLTGRIDAGVLAESLKTEIGGISTNAESLRQEVLNRLAAEQGISDTLLQTQEYADISMTAVIDETKQREDANSAVVESINILYAQAGESTAAITEEANIRAQQYSALAEQITTATSALGDDIAQVQIGLTTKIDTVDGKVTEIGALYSAKVNVNGLIGGFGVYNDGTTVDAGFDVDTFWVGRTGANKRKPFIIVGNETFIDEAVINRLTFSKLRADDGSFIVENGKLKANYIEARGLRVVSDSGVVGLNVDAAGDTTFGGTLNGADGTFSGDLTAARISVGTASDATTFFEPGYPGVGLNSSASKCYSLGYIDPSTAVLTNGNLSFRHNATSTVIDQRIRSGNVFFSIMCSALVDDQLSIWYRLNGGSWIWMNGMLEPQVGDGTVAVGFGLIIAVPVGGIVEFGASTTDQTGGYRSNKFYLKSFQMTVIARNF